MLSIRGEQHTKVTAYNIRFINKQNPIPVEKSIPFAYFVVHTHCTAHSGLDHYDIFHDIMAFSAELCTTA